MGPKGATKFKSYVWEELPDRLVLYDYIGGNPSKGGIFRSGPSIKSDGLIQSWAGHLNFEMKGLRVYVRRSPSFFETFPVILADLGGTTTCDIPFRRSDIVYSIEQSKLIVYISSKTISGLEYSEPTTVKNYCRKSQFREVFYLDKAVPKSEGVYRTSSRGWYPFSHLSLSLLFIFGHIWHSGRAQFKGFWTGLVIIKQTVLIGYGHFEKLGV